MESTASISALHVKKRNGELMRFDKHKIESAIFKAAKSVGRNDVNIRKVADKVIFSLSGTPSVEQIQDKVEEALMKEGHTETAKAYILYRQKKAELRNQKKEVLEKEELDEVDKRFDVNALRVMKSRYLRKSEDGKLMESPKELFMRVNTHSALPDLFYDEAVFDYDARQLVHPYEDFDWESSGEIYSVGKFKLNQYHMEALKRLYDRFNNDRKMKVSWKKLLVLLEAGHFNNYEKNIEEFYDLMTHRKFIANTPAMANFGNPLGMGSACFVMDVEDSIEHIMETLKQTSIVFKAGGGMGYNFSKLRPEGDFVSTTGGVASGPISFMRLFDTMTEVIKQGGIRRGANMGILNSNHPDIEKFITAKAGNKALKNFNISVLIMPDFWEYYESNEPYPLLNPRTQKIVKTVNPRELFDRIVYQAWESAEPGIIFYDRVNKYNPFYDYLGPIVTTNPCVSADTLISTEKGLQTISQIENESIAVDTRLAEDSGNLITIKNGTKLVKPFRVVKTGIKEVYKIVTKSGYEIKATKEHKIMTERGWIQVSELDASDRIHLQSGQGSFKDEAELPFKVDNPYVGENGIEYNFNFPSKWNYNLGLVMGWLVGDGFVSDKYNTVGFVFSPNDSEAQKKIQPILEHYFKREIKPRKYDNGCVQIRSNSRYVTNFFMKLGYNAKEREVPCSVFTASKEGVIGFLSGLFSADGTIGMGSKSRNYIRLNSSSLKLLKQVQLMLLNLGIRSSIYDRSTEPKVFTYETSDGHLKEYQTTGKNYELNVSKENLNKFIGLIPLMQSRHMKKIALLKNFEFYSESFTDALASKELVGKEEVWDITEPQTHSFIANGIVVHNCGEVLLYPYESCNLGSINVWKFAVEDEDGNVDVDWNSLAKAVRLAAKFLDNVIEVNKFPLKEIENMALWTRKTGLGVMGVADLLYELDLPYNSDEGRAFMEKMMQFINYHSKVESVELARTRGNLPYYNKSFYPEGMLPIRGFDLKDEWEFDWAEVSENVKKYGVRNGYTTVIAPTGSISMIAGCSSGMEPNYSLVFEKNVKVGSFFYSNHVVEKILRRKGIYTDDIMKKIADNGGRVTGLSEIPAELQEVLVTSMDITPEDHIRALAAFQKWTDSSISKTNNFPADATVEHMRESYLLAYKLHCKDVTVFRDSSIKDQVLNAPKKKEEKEIKTEVKSQKAEVESHTASGMLIQQHNGVQNGVNTIKGEEAFMAEAKKEARGKLMTNCPECKTALDKKEGCVTCPSCGWGLCS